MHPQPLRYSPVFSYKLGHADVCTFIKECIAVGILWRRLVLSGPAWMWRLHVRRRLTSVRAFAHDHGTHRLPIISLSAHEAYFARGRTRSALDSDVVAAIGVASRPPRPRPPSRPSAPIRSRVIRIRTAEIMAEMPFVCRLNVHARRDTWKVSRRGERSRRAARGGDVHT